MKKFKVFDVWVSIILIASFTILIIIDAYHNDDWRELVLTSYFVVGGWHVISMLVHTVCNWFIKTSTTRVLYQILSFVLLVTIPCGSVWILAVAAPFMAIFYTILCYRETYIKMKRPLDDLK
jgi:hypothetical protein